VLKSWQAVNGIEADDYPEDGERERERPVSKGVGFCLLVQPDNSSRKYEGIYLV
jgi:hypothetical protein